ncbi:hypothetical protein ABBQ32_005463 [Trebouxia sp. C0010 RCD-2024]
MQMLNADDAILEQAMQTGGVSPSSGAARSDSSRPSPLNQSMLWGCQRGQGSLQHGQGRFLQPQGSEPRGASRPVFLRLSQPWFWGFKPFCPNTQPAQLQEGAAESMAWAAKGSRGILGLLAAGRQPNKRLKPESAAKLLQPVVPPHTGPAFVADQTHEEADIMQLRTAAGGDGQVVLPQHVLAEGQQPQEQHVVLYYNLRPDSHG